jgi:ATP-dependent helicase/nuclease subunit A
MSILTVYKASAGSGKTFQLTSEYLKIIFRNPDDFKYILAVTFTHKATAEMKGRILRELHNLSLCNETQMSKILCHDLSITSNELYKKASIILKKILQHYSQFHISTIDSFFQGIISSFARDLGLQANFAVELNSSKVLNAVVDSLLLNLEKDPLLARWLIDFAEEKVIQGESWELKEEIQSLGQELFKEEYAFEQLRYNSGNRKEVIAHFRHDIMRRKKEKEGMLREIVKKIKSELAAAGLKVEDFSYGWSGVMGYLHKLPENPAKPAGARAIEASLSSEKWANKSSVNREIIIQLAGRLLINLLNEAIELSNEYFTLELLNSNIYSLGILSDLQASISAYAQEHNVFLLDQSPWLINRLMDSNDAPFIYEKAGNQFQYFMIDEFQDTSSLQWKNFLPLILNSLSQEKPCMLVGDVKQSIYRWRNSSWKTLASMKDEENAIKVLPLDTNWRSRPLLIRFNNSLFTLASHRLQELFDKNYKNSGSDLNPFSNLIPTAYDGLKQNILNKPDDNSGYAAIRFIDKKNQSDQEEEESEGNSSDQALIETRKFIDKLLSSNYSLKDIAILVRNKKEGTKIAEYLVNQKSSSNLVYRVISNDALYLEKSSAVKILVAVIQWIVDDKDECNNLFLASEFDSKRLINTADQEFPSYYKGDDLFPFLPAALVMARERLSILSLFDLVEHIIFLLKLTEEQGQYPYLQAFIDVVHDFCTTESAGIPAFLDWWQENSVLFTINGPEEQDAIRIVTIHKAKGLEFRAVIIPFCKWEIDHKPPHMPILWCDTSNTEFSELGLVPIRYKNDVGNSIFADRYYDEKIQTFVDNLNLLYVAFTRAKDCLYAICELTEKSNKIGNLIHNVFYDAKGSELIKKLGMLGIDSFVQNSSVQTGLIEFGSVPLITKTDTIEPDSDLIKKISLPGNRIHVRAHAEEFFLPLLDPEREGKINRGLIIHEALSGIRTAADINSSLKILFSKGLINLEELNELESEISEMIKDPIVNSWFTSEWIIMRETGILEKGVGIQRPDRIMISGKKVIVVDYKTGETENRKYRYQLGSYLSALRKMGFSDVKGYLWYLRLKKVEEVMETQ